MTMTKIAGATRIFTGTKVFHMKSGNSAALLFTDSEYESLFGRAWNQAADVVAASNSDGNACGVHIDGTTHTSDGWHVVFDRPISDNWVRVTWAVILGSSPINLGQADG